MKIYYAHSKKIYYSKREKKELAIIRRRYPSAKIINPAGLFRQEVDWRIFMAYDLPEMDLVIFSDFNGYIGKGVFEEILTAIENGIPVLYLNEQGRVTAMFSIGEPNPEDWVLHCRVTGVF